MLERLGPDGPADVVDQDVQATKTFNGGLHHALAFAVLLKIGGQREAVLAQLLLQFEHQFGAVDQDQPRTFGRHAFGDPPADALGGAGNEGDFFVESVHVYLDGSGAAVLVRAHAALAANFS